MVEHKTHWYTFPYLDDAYCQPSKLKLVLFLPDASPDEKSKPTRLGRTFRSVNPWFYLANERWAIWMSNRGQVWDHKSLLKPKSFSKSPLDRILVPDYKFMVAIIDRIVSSSIFRKICIFQEKIQLYSYYPRLVHILSLKCLRIFIVNQPRTIWIIRKGCGWCE